MVRFGGVRAVSSKDVVLEVLRAIGYYAAFEEKKESVVFTKAEFIKAYWRLRRKGRVPAVKIETLLRTLRELAAGSDFLAYADGRGGKYVLNTLKLPW